MKRRVRVYLIGVLLGSFLAYFTMIRGREERLFAWLPSKRIIYDIENLKRVSTEEGECKLKAAGISRMIKQAVIEEADIDLSASVVDTIPRVYKFVAPVDGKEIALYYAIWLDSVAIVDVDVDGQNIICNK